MSDPVLVTCPQCHQDTYQKQLTAAGFQLFRLILKRNVAVFFKQFGFDIFDDLTS